MEVGADTETIIAALLHDVVEDTQYTSQNVEEIFGNDVALLIEGMTKFSKEKFRDAQNLDRKIESLRKWFIVMEKDVRVGVIKIADRIHNMRTLNGHNNVKKQTSIAKETLDVYIKIADKLGIIIMKNELEELCLKNIDINTYNVLTKIQEKNYQESQKFILEVENKIKKFKKHHSITSIFSEKINRWEMYRNGIHEKNSLQGILSLNITIMVNTIEECYSLLHTIHSLWTADREGLKDFISTPSANGYQGIDTKVFFSGQSISFRLVTASMHKNNLYGICQFCFSENKNHMNIYNWLHHLSDVTKTGTQGSNTFLQTLEYDILKETIVVHSSTKEYLILPPVSTALDAAFYEYKEKALYVHKIFVNGKISKLYSPIKNNDSISLILSKKKEVQYEWLRYTNTTLAHKYIRQGSTEENREKKIHLGQKILQEEFNHYDLGILEEYNEKIIVKDCQDFNISSFEDLLKKIGNLEIPAIEIIKKVAPKSLGQISSSSEKYTAEIAIIRNKDSDLLQNIFSHLKAHTLSFLHKKTTVNIAENSAYDLFSIQIKNSQLFSFLLENLNLLYGVKKVNRVFPNHLLKGYIFAFLFAILLGAYSVLIRYIGGYEGITAEVSAPIRLFFGAITLWFFLIIIPFVTKQKIVFPNIKNRWFILLALTNGLCAFLFHKGLETTFATKGILFENSSSLLILIGIIVLKKPLLSKPTQYIIFSSMALGGMGLISFFLQNTEKELIGNFWMFINVISFAVFIIAGKQCASKNTGFISNISLTAFSLLGGFIFLLPITDFEGIYNLSSDLFFLCALLGVFASGLAYSFFFIASRYLTPLIINFFLIFSTGIAFTLEYFLLNTPISKYFLFGILFLLFTSFLLSNNKVQKILNSSQK